MRLSKSPLNELSNGLFARLVLNTLNESDRDHLRTGMKSQFSGEELARLNQVKGRSHKEFLGHRSVA